MLVDNLGNVGPGNKIDAAMWAAGWPVCKMPLFASPQAPTVKFMCFLDSSARFITFYRLTAGVCNLTGFYRYGFYR